MRKPTEDEQQIARILLDRTAPSPEIGAALTRVQQGEDTSELDLDLLHRLAAEKRQQLPPRTGNGGAGRLHITTDDLERATRLYGDPRLKPQERRIVERVHDALVSRLLGQKLPLTQTDLSVLRRLDQALGGRVRRQGNA